MINQNLERLIKKHIHGRPQKGILLSSPGFSTLLKQEVEQLIATSVLPKKFDPIVNEAPGFVRVENCEYSLLAELCLRSRLASDVSIILHYGKAYGELGFKKECLRTDWELYFKAGSTLKIQCDSVASKLYHEGLMLEIMSEVVSEKGYKVDASSEGSQLIRVQLKKDYVTISLSLAGEPLSHRHYKKNLFGSAPLREDTAASCIEAAYDFMSEKGNLPESFYVPFAGSGTFAFEILLRNLDIPSFIFRRNFSLEDLECHGVATFSFMKRKLLSRLIEKSENIINQTILCHENHQEMFQALCENVTQFVAMLADHTPVSNRPVIHVENQDFFKTNPDVIARAGGRHIFVPMNPPYGLRLQQGSSRDYYKKIGKSIKNLIASANTLSAKVSGFVLCPDEATWSAFLNGAEISDHRTSHFTQGGLDVRLCVF